MGGLALAAAAVTLAAALAAVGLGRRWTRSVVCAQLAVAGLAVALAGAGAGALGWLVALAGGAGLALLQVYGWMLVDVDRDHLPPTEAGTRVARSLAFVLLGGGLVLLVTFAAGELATRGGESGAARASASSASSASSTKWSGPIVSADAVGAALFGASPATALVLGAALAAALLTSVLLLRSDDVALVGSDGPSAAGNDDGASAGPTDSPGAMDETGGEGHG